MISGMVMGMDAETGGESRRDEMGGKNRQKGMAA